MPLLEKIVRPVVARDLRPSSVRPAIASETDDEQVEITSSGARIVNLTHSLSYSYTHPSRSERREDINPKKGQPKRLGRIYDIWRIYRVKTPQEAGPDSNDPSVPRDEKYIDRKKYIDVEIVREVWMVNEEGDPIVLKFSTKQPAFNEEVIKTGLWRDGQ